MCIRAVSSESTQFAQINEWFVNMSNGMSLWKNKKNKPYLEIYDYESILFSGQFAVHFVILKIFHNVSYYLFIYHYHFFSVRILHALILAYHFSCVDIFII